MRISVSIVVHKTPYHQLLCAVECLCRSDKVVTIDVVDNSPDNFLATITEVDKRIRYIHTENRGFGAGHNISINSVLRDSENDDIHIVMNADIWWEGDAVSKIADYMATHRNVGLISPKTYYPDGELQYTCRMLPTPFDLFIKRFVPLNIFKNRMESYLLANHNHDKILNCPYLLGSFMCFRIGALKDCGVFDERFFMYPEDIDITRRIHKHWLTIYYPEVSIVHEHRAASRKNLKMLFVHITNMIKYFNKWGWFFDKERSLYNKLLKNGISYIPKAERPRGRG